jgi:pentatricopeptide repeat protein
MLIQGTTLHKIVHGSLFEFLFRINEDQVLGIIEKTAKDGVTAADNGCITLLKELCRIQKVSLAEKVLQTFDKAGLVPTTEMYNILIDGYCKIKELQGAFLLCRQMESHGQVVPNEATYDALLLAVRNNTSIMHWEDVVELFEKNGVSTDALNSDNSATYGFEYRDSLVPRMFNKLVSKLF